MPYIIYPLLLCLIPVILSYAENQSEISNECFLKALIGISTIILSGFTILYFITRNLNISALLLSVNFFLLLYANYIFIGLFSKYKRTKKTYNITYSVSYIILCTILSISLYYLLKNFNLALLNKIMFYISSGLIFFIVLDIFNKANISITAIKEKSDETSLKKTDISYPDIYHIILDAHSGFANPEICDEEFKVALEERGFNIYKNFKSNYPQTHLSVPSMFNMDYIHNILKNQNTYPPAVTYPLYAQNLVHDELEKMGYKTSIFMNKLLQNIFTKNKLKINFHQDNQLKNILIFSSLIKSTFCLKSDDSSNNFEELINVFANSEITDSPQYKFVHTLAPHSPYYFDKDGKKRTYFELHDIKNYYEYMLYVDKSIIKLIDNIKSKMKKNSIIIIHSDHGREYSQSKWNVLLAVYFPEDKLKDAIPQNGSLVNLFKYLFNELFCRNYEISEEIFYKLKNDSSLEKIDNPDIQKG